jgi:transposase
MARAYGVDLRARVVESIEGGLSHRQAAARFEVGIATAGAWHRAWRRTGAMRPGRQGNPGRSKLDAHEGFILGLIEERKDIALHEMAERLDAEHGLRVHPSTIWYFLDRRAITFKKRPRTPPSRSGRTSQRRARPGSRASSASTPSA